MTVEYLRYTVEADRVNVFIEDYVASAEPLMASPWCTSFDLCQCDEDPTKFIIRLEWTSADDHMQKFRGSDEFKRFFTHIRGYLDNIDEMRHYTRLEHRDTP